MHHIRRKSSHQPQSQSILITRIPYSTGVYIERRRCVTKIDVTRAQPKRITALSLSLSFNTLYTHASRVKNSLHKLFLPLCQCMCYMYVYTSRRNRARARTPLKQGINYGRPNWDFRTPQAKRVFSIAPFSFLSLLSLSLSRSTCTFVTSRAITHRPPVFPVIHARTIPPRDAAACASLFRKSRTRTAHYTRRL